MGKGARNRAKRKGTANVEQLLDRLLSVDSFEAFNDLLTMHPEMQNGEVLNLLDTWRRRPGIGITFNPWFELVNDAVDDPERAYEAFAQSIADSTRVGETLEGEAEAIGVAIDQHRPEEAIARSDAAILAARDANLALLVGHLEEQRAKATMQLTSGDRAENVERAIAGFNAALEFAAEPDVAAGILMHLGLAAAQRVRGDRGENIEEGIALLYRALGELTPDSPPDLWAIIQTNLASALLRRERGDRTSNLREAADFCRQALDHRSPEKNAYDWAHSQLNLGAILQDLAFLEGNDTREAEQAYEEIISEAMQVGEAWLIGHAHFSLGRLRRIATERNAEEILQAVESDDEEAQKERIAREAALLDAALIDLQTARALTEDDPDPIRHGRVLLELAAVLDELESQDEAIEIAREALTKLRPTSAPADCVGAGFRLGGLLAKQGDWEEAANAYRDAVQATELLFHGRLDTESREREIRNAGQLARWGSYAVARAGEFEEAALILESGRTRELRRRIQHADVEQGRLDLLPSDLREAYLTTTADLARTPLGPSASTSARSLQEILTVIRSISGFEDFATGARSEDLFGAAEVDWPLIYVNPTPEGTALIKVDAADGRHVVDVRFLAPPTSKEIFEHIALGDFADSPVEGSAKPHSYFFSISGGDRRELQAALAELLPWVGQNLSKPIHDWLSESMASGVTLVLCGPLGLVPVAAADWFDDSRRRCLLDDFGVRYAPSALLSAASRRRALERTTLDPYLVALADPTGDLRAAGPEVVEVAKHFGERVTSAEGPAATSTFLRENSAKATHLHLACHAGGGLVDPENSGVVLSDGLLPAHQLTTVGELTCRLVVISACQTAVSPVSELPDEVFATSTAMLGAGSACAIASLWSVDDAATALLMTRVYHELMTNDLSPPQALRQAQLWLRDITEEAEEDFLASHPALEAEFRRRIDEGDRPGHRGASGNVAGDAKHYSHPVYWAPFIAVGA